jgi:hypothetical protein
VVETAILGGQIGSVAKDLINSGNNSDSKTTTSTSTVKFDSNNPIVTTTAQQDATRNVVNVLPIQAGSTTTPTGNSTTSTVSAAGYAKQETDHAKQIESNSYRGF